MLTERLDPSHFLALAFGVLVLAGLAVGVVSHLDADRPGTETGSRGVTDSAVESTGPSDSASVAPSDVESSTVSDADASDATTASSSVSGEEDPTGRSVPGAAEIPDGVVDRAVDTSAVTVEFARPEDPVLFYYNSHDPAVVSRKGSGYYLVTHNEIGRRLLYRSGKAIFDPTVAGSWLPVATDFLGRVPDSSVDTMVRAKGRYYAYVNGSVYTTPDVESGNWTRRSDAPPGDDQGVYYDADRDRFHLFYEAGTRANHSGTRIGHATSPSGVDNWTVYPPVYAVIEGYGVGDFDVVERDGVYVLFGDYTRDHPNYSVSVWVNDNLYTNFTRLGTAMTPSSGETRFDSFGVQDAELLQVAGEGRYVMYAHGHVGELGPRYLHYYPGRIVVEDGAVTDG